MAANFLLLKVCRLFKQYAVGSNKHEIDFKPMRKDIVILDFDGTLGDTRRVIVSTMQATMKELELPVADEDACVGTIGLSLRDVFLKLYPALPSGRADDYVSVYHRLFTRNKELMPPRLFPGVKETLRILKERGMLLTVASSRSSASLRELLAQLGISAYISYILGADDVEHPKPHPEPVLRTLRDNSVKPERAVVVGDMPVDVQMGTGAGVQTIGVTYGNSSAEELRSAGADYVIDDFSELLERIG